MRGVAASMVAFWYFAAVAADVYGSERGLSSSLRTFHSTICQSGVDIFFCISEFIIVLITGKQRRNTVFRDAAYFLFRRIIRIYPLFWIALAASIIVERTWLTIASEQAWLTVVGHGPLASIVLYDTPVALPIAWTLMFEVRFYALIAMVLLVFRAKLQKGILIACLGIVTCVSLTSLPDPALRPHRRPHHAGICLRRIGGIGSHQPYNRATTRDGYCGAVLVPGNNIFHVWRRRGLPHLGLRVSRSAVSLRACHY